MRPSQILGGFEDLRCGSFASSVSRHDVVMGDLKVAWKKLCD